MLTYVHKVIHLVVGIFEQGFETPLAHCREKMEVTVSDRTPVSVGPVRPVNDTAKMIASVFDRMLGHLVTGR